MKNPIILAVASVLLASCTHNDSHQLEPGPSLPSASPQRAALVGSLKKLGKAFKEKNAAGVEAYFRFPLADSTIDLYVDDSSFEKEREYSGGTISRQMFHRFFTQIWNDMQLEQLGFLFQHIDPSRLAATNQITYRDIRPGQPCYAFYEVSLLGDEVTLTFGTNTNDDYQAQAKDGGEEQSGDECEFASIWYMKFDGQHLYFVRQASAG